MSDQEIYTLVERRRKSLGLTQADVSRMAFGRSDTGPIQSLRRGNSPTAKTLRALCKALGLEFYVGPPRDGYSAAVSSDAPSEPLQIDNRRMGDRLEIVVGDDDVAEFAAKAGLDEVTLRRYIAGRKPTLSHLKAIAAVHGASLEWLATGDGSVYAEEQFVEITPELARKLDMKAQYVRAICIRLYAAQDATGARLSPEAFYVALSMIHQVMLEKFQGEDAPPVEMEKVLAEYVDNLMEQADSAMNP